jgi:DNA-binding phage protein
MNWQWPSDRGFGMPRRRDRLDSVGCDRPALEVRQTPENAAWFARLRDRAAGRGSILARDTGRESLRKALSPSGNPECATVMKVVAAPGLKPHATPAGS